MCLVREHKYSNLLNHLQLFFNPFTTITVATRRTTLCPKKRPPFLFFNTNCSSFSFFHVYRVPIRYTDDLLNGSVLLRHGLNFSRTWWMIQLISGKKDCKHASVQNVVTLNICCNVACLTFHLPHTTTGSFQSHQRLEERTYLHSDENVVHFTR